MAIYDEKHIIKFLKANMHNTAKKNQRNFLPKRLKHYPLMKRTYLQLLE